MDPLELDSLEALLDTISDSNEDNVLRRLREGPPNSPFVKAVADASGMDQAMAAFQDPEVSDFETRRVWLATQRAWVNVSVNLRQDLPRSLSRDTVRYACPTALHLELLILAAGAQQDPVGLSSSSLLLGATWACVPDLLTNGEFEQTRGDVEGLKTLKSLLALDCCDAAGSEGSQSVAVLASWQLWTLVWLLIEAGAEPDPPILCDEFPFDFTFPLYVAAETGNLAAVKHLLGSGADPNATNERGDFNGESFDITWQGTALDVANGDGVADMLHAAMQQEQPRPRRTSQQARASVQRIRQEFQEDFLRDLSAALQVVHIASRESTEGHHQLPELALDLICQHTWRLSAPHLWSWLSFPVAQPDSQATEETT